MSFEIRVTEKCIRNAEEILNYLIIIKDKSLPATAKSNLKTLSKKITEIQKILRDFE